MKRSELLEIAKPILYNTPMTQAVLEDRKTATRRLVKPQPLKCTCEDCEKRDEIYFNASSGYIRCRNCNSAIYNGKGKFCFASYNVGDILYVRETWNYGIIERSDVEYSNEYWFEECDRNHEYMTFEPRYFYKADLTESDEYELGLEDEDGDRQKMLWHPSIHMPKEAARIFLKVTDVRVERLQDITEEQAEQEGVLSTLGIAARTGFKTVWNSTVKKADLYKYGWDANPWVWVIAFERLEVEEDSKV